MRILFFVVAYNLMVIYILNIEKGDYVTRNSYDNDTVFKVINIKNGVYYLKGVEVRLIADAEVTDLRKEENINEDNVIDDIDLLDTSEAQSIYSSFFEKGGNNER